MKSIPEDGSLLSKKSIRYVAQKCGDIIAPLARAGIFPCPLVGFKFDNEKGYYHAEIDCPQGSLFDGYLGYNVLYDVAFDLGTSMETGKYDFSSDGKEYTLWAWKGDYLNMGAGCEIGIYEKGEDQFSEACNHYIVNKNLAMNMSLTLTMDGKVVGSYDGKNWWATSFNPFVQHVKAKDLTATYTVSFNDGKMYEAFKNSISKSKVEESEKKWTFSDDSKSATLIL